MHRTVLCGVLLLLSSAAPASAAMYQVLAESDIDSIPGSQFFVSSFNSLADFLSGSPASTAFSTWSIGSVYSARGVAYDGSQFHVLAESDIDSIPGSQFFISSFNSVADILNGNPASTTFSAWSIGSVYSVGGLTYDGSQFHVLAESDIDSFPGSQFFVSSFNSLADFLSGSPASTAFSTWSIGSVYSVGGLAYDGSQFHVLAESDIDSFPGSQFFISDFNSLADFLSGTSASTAFSAWSIGSVYSVGGFEAIPEQTQPVPEPSTGILLGIGFAGLVASYRRRRAA